MCYTVQFQNPAQSYEFAFQYFIDILRFYFEEAEKAKTEYDVIDAQSIGEWLLLSLEKARLYIANHLSDSGEQEVIDDILHDAENNHLLPLFADPKITGSNHAAYLLRQLPQFQDWYDPKEGDIAVVLHPENANSITREFHKGSWRDIVSINTNPEHE